MRGIQKKKRKKKLVIRNYAVKPKVPENFLADGWKLLENAIDAIYARIPVPHTREKLYGIVEDLCMHGQSASLFARVKGKFAERVNSLVRDLSQQTGRRDTLLSFVHGCWASYCENLRYIQSIFLYLETNGGLSASGTGDSALSAEPRSLWGVCAHLFHDKLEQKAFTQQKLLEAALTALQSARNGQIVDTTHLRNFTDMYWNLDLYGTRFEPAVLRTTRDFYRSEAENNVVGLGVAEYLKFVANRLTEERRRGLECLRPTTCRAVLSVLRAEMVTAHSATILGRGFESMMEAEQFDELRRMYTLFLHASADGDSNVHEEGDRTAPRTSNAQNSSSPKQRNSGNADDSGESSDGQGRLILDMMNAYGSYIVKKGLQIVAECRGNELQFVDRMLAFKSVIDRACVVAFQNSRDFVELREHSMTRIMNHRASKPAEALARYFDRLLKDQTRLGSTTRRDSAVDDAMVLFRYINNKDVFEACFSRDLSRRLLLKTSTSSELELAIVQRLKAECGNMYTTKMEGMFQDILRADGLNAQFTAWLLKSARTSPSDSSTAAIGDTDGHQKNPAFSVRVLTMGTWPTYPKAPPSLQLPEFLAKLQDQFRRFYVSKFRSRSLEFLPTQGQVVLKATFGYGSGKRRQHELHVSEYQALVLLVFNIDPTAVSASTLDDQPRSFTFMSLMSATGIPRNELQQTLLSLCSNKAKILKRRPSDNGHKGSHGSLFDDAERVVVNDNMKSKLVRIVVNAYQGKLTKKDVQATNQRVQRERMFQVDAAIVRLMKARLTMAHQALLLEVQKHLKFEAQPQMLKKRIESLLEREYLERDSSQAGVYHYTA
eukprot:INCI15434.3.p1 GENE.INCI15434.3~~INCI15434.3.p1  ORF type:complete len:848 (-),score=178.00 INCI15434.3:670-3162(-)